MTFGDIWHGQKGTKPKTKHEKLFSASLRFLRFRNFPANFIEILVARQPTSNSCNLYQLILNFSGFAYVYRIFSWGFQFSLASALRHYGSNYIKLAFSFPAATNHSWWIEVTCADTKFFRISSMEFSREEIKNSWSLCARSQSSRRGHAVEEKGQKQVFWILLMAVVGFIYNHLLSHCHTIETLSAHILQMTFDGSFH